MNLDNLWAGWRSDYVASVFNANDDAEQPAPSNGQDPRCVFCRILAADATDEERFIVRRGARCIAILNAYPYSNGHLLVMPIRHFDELAMLDQEEAAELWMMTREATVALKRAFDAEGLNFGANLGRAAGAGIPAHLHIHVVPRWIGDTNFMTTVASVRVLPEALPRTWEKLVAAWPQTH